MIKKMAAMVENEVFTIMTIDTEWSGPDGEGGQRVYAGLSSNPTFVEIPENSEVTLGWIWNGESFSPPIIEE